MVVDMQGSGHTLFDPEIASEELVQGEEVLFSTGNFWARILWHLSQFYDPMSVPNWLPEDIQIFLY